MRFRFCGDLEAPSWLLNEMTTLSEISSVRLKLVVKQVVAQMLSGSLDWAKVAKFTTPKDSDMDLSVTKATLSALYFVVASAAKYDVDDETLATEIEQLGLPRENAVAVCRPYRDNRAALRTKFATDTFAVGRAASVSWSSSSTTGARGDDELNNPGDADASAVVYRLRLDLQTAASVVVKGGNATTTQLDCDVSADKFAVFMHEMTQVQSLMDSLEE